MTESYRVATQGIRRCFAFAAIFLLAGCYSRDIYQPDAPEGKLIEAWYLVKNGNPYGPWDTIEFEREGVHIGVEVVMGDALDLSFSIPEGMKVTLPIPVITILSSDAKDALKLQADHYFWYEAAGGQRQSRRIEVPMIGQQYQEKWGRWHRSSTVTFKFPQPLVDDFEAAFPSILVNGKEVAIPNVHFHREKKLLPYTF